MTFISPQNLLDSLVHSPFFEDLPKNVVEALCKKLTIVEFGANYEVINKGDDGNSMYIILSGKVKIHDQHLTLTELSAGSVFGEMALIDNSPRSMSVSTLTECQMGVLSREDFYDVMKNYPDIFKYLISTLSNRLRNQNEVLLNQYRKRENELTELVKARTEELEKRNNELSDALEEVRHSQVMIIRQAKLASLGELISDIAHEIQNPLNFVTNFSELSIELIEELKHAKGFSPDEEALKDLSQISEKINHHGKRAEAILKSMLKHHRNERRHMEQGDVNSICEEAIKVAIYSIKSRIPDFKFEVEKVFGKKIPLIELVKHDIFRLVVNLLDNSFYSTNERLEYSIANKIDYTAKIKIETQLANDKINLYVTDNGVGVDSSIREKIFQPFYTTKPAGDGTGLGLSLSFDIVTAHGGKIDFTSDKEKTIFHVELPISSGKK
ncbi:MAG TPA: cyclic nucleotide-binding domain-containing protein [Bacteroidia bacterium]|nr:cyclic nucleotide-binding domain-containing protein [Bacteroidia bacterium]HQW22933.1 cyclic nucleotide-binding domain-containing protein [Bacteroidia bacterium]